MDNVAENKYNAVEKNINFLEQQFASEDEDTVQRNTPYPVASYLNEAQDLSYYEDLLRTYTFWRKVLVRIMKRAKITEEEQRTCRAHDEKMERGEFEGANQKFKHAFFSMLTLTILLLAILLICVYLLKRNHLTFAREDHHGVRGYL